MQLIITFCGILVICLGWSTANAQRATSCVRCSGSQQSQCARMNGYDAINGNLGVICASLFCSTVVRNTFSGFQVQRDCGAVSCDNLPADVVANRPEICDNVTNTVKTIPVGLLFNQTRSFASNNPADDNGLSVLLQYCDRNLYCNSGPFGYLQKQTAAVQLTARSCIQCNSYITEDCGASVDYSGGNANITSTACNAGYCFTLVRASPGATPYVERGCGGVQCSIIPGGLTADSCDIHGVVRTVSAKSGLPFNQTRAYNTENAGSASLQYCTSGDNCNSGLVVNMPRNFFYLSGDGAVSRPILSCLGLVIVTVIMGALSWF